MEPKKIFSEAGRSEDFKFGFDVTLTNFVTEDDAFCVLRFRRFSLNKNGYPEYIDLERRFLPGHEDAKNIREAIWFLTKKRRYLNQHLGKEHHERAK